MTNKEKLTLGSVQFGINYGIANQTGRVTPEEVSKILKTAKTNNISTIDTAIAYGDSESVLGRQDLTNFSIVSKLPEVPNDTKKIGRWVNDQVERSLDRLRVPALNGLLLHRPCQLNSSFGRELYLELISLKKQGLVKRIGISIYKPEELDSLIPHYHFDIIQSPYSVIDNRILESKWAYRFESEGTAIHARSVFLQGLLLMPKNIRPKKFSRWDKLWCQWDKWLTDTKQSPVSACINHVLSRPEIEKVIIGVDSEKQLEQILDLCDKPYIKKPDKLKTYDCDLLNPSDWNYL